MRKFAAFCQNDDTPITKDLTDDSPTFTWTANDDPSITVGAEEGYQIQVNVTVLNLDGENGDYIMIQSCKNPKVKVDQKCSHPSTQFGSIILVLIKDIQYE